MKIFSIVTVLLAMFISVPAKAEIRIHTYKMGTPIEFNSQKPAWYKSAKFRKSDDEQKPFEVALESDEVYTGEWSMHFTNPKIRPIDMYDAEAHLFFVGMRYRFD